jgi:hypothetical protein
MPQQIQTARPISTHELEDTDLKKADVHHDEAANDLGGMAQEDYDFIKNYPPDQVAKIYSKLDWRLIPMLAILYLFACTFAATAV